MATPALPPIRPIPAAAVDYPESDGRPMAETDVHARSMIDLRAALENHFRDAPDVYVSGNLLMYYEQGDPQQSVAPESVAPDIFVVRGVAKRLRRVYKLWEEQKAPDVVLEITSRSTRWEDLATKRGLYEVLGVQEYFLYDPLGEYLRPALQGFRLVEHRYEPIAPTGEGALASEALGLELRLAGGRLRLYDPHAGQWLLTPAEEAAARQAAEAQAAAEAAARQAAEARLAAAEAELGRLRAQLARQTNRQDSAGSP